MTAAAMPAGRTADDGPTGHAVEGALSSRYDVALLDLDGVVYRGRAAVPGAPEALLAARADGMRLAFVTNNASRTAEQIVVHLGELGVDAAPSEVVTSAQAAATLAAQRIRPGGRVFVVGSDGLREAITAVGLTLVEAYDSLPAPELVVQGFSPDLRYEDLAQAALVVAGGADWIATNTDQTLPTARGLQPGNGTLVAAVAAAAGRRPVVAGKPERALVDEVVRRSAARRPLMIGDRLDTDIEGAVRADMDSLLVLTGVSTVADLLAAGPDSRPTYLGADLSALATDQAPLAPPTSTIQRDSGWRVETHGGTATLTKVASGPGQPLDAVRTLVVAAWAAADAGQPVTSVLVPEGQLELLAGAGVPAALMRISSAGARPASTEAGDARAGS